MNALLYAVARANVDRIYGDGRFDWIDNDFTEAIVTVAGTMTGHPRYGEALAVKLRNLAAQPRNGRRR